MESGDRLRRGQSSGVMRFVDIGYFRFSKALINNVNDSDTDRSSATVPSQEGSNLVHELRASLRILGEWSVALVVPRVLWM